MVLEALYERYTVKAERSQRNKVILSLLVYQGISNEVLFTYLNKFIEKEDKPRLEIGFKRKGK